MSSRTRSGQQQQAQRGPSRCLDAFIVALQQASDETGSWYKSQQCWYTSTRQLQLASLEFCTACRSVPTLIVTVEKDTPTRLWMDDPARESGSAKRLAATRVPVIRAHAVTWKLSASALRSMGHVLSKAKRFRLFHYFNGDVRGVTWPRELKGISFGCGFNQPITGVTWPASLEELDLGETFKQPLQGVTWPQSLQTLVVGGSGSITGTIGPVSLKFLYLYYGFDQPIDTITWPPALETLWIGGDDFDQPVTGVKWPGSLRTIEFGDEFNQPIDRVQWPASLEEVCFGSMFEHPIAGVSWPSSLKILSLDRCLFFNHPIAGVSWPSSLKNFTLGRGLYFNQPVDEVRWPASMERLTFGRDFNQPITAVVWPSSLQQLKFGMRFNQPIADVCWPDSLRELSFCGDVDMISNDGEWIVLDREELYGVLSDFNQPIHEVGWPPSLLSISFGEAFEQPVAGVAWPASLRKLAFMSRNFRLPSESFEWPASLQELTIARRPNEPLPSWPGMSAKRPLLSPEPAGDEDAFTPRRPTAAGGNKSAVPVATDTVATDTAWAVAFKVNVAVTLLSAVYFGVSGWRALDNGRFPTGDDAGHHRRLLSGGGVVLAPVLFCMGTVGLGWGFARAMLHLTITFSRQILQVAYLSFIAVWAVAAVTALATGHWLLWLVPAFMCAWCTRFFWRRRSRIHFGAANLKVAALAVRSMPRTIRAVFLTGGVQVLWFLLSVFTMGTSLASFQQVTAPDGSVYPASDCRDVASPHSCQCRGEVVSYNSSCSFEARPISFWAYCFWVASLFWGFAVINNVATATVTGAVASWWFYPGDPNPVRAALHRATHGSFGSLCKAAAISSAVQLFVYAARRLSKAGRWGSYLMEWVRNIVDYVLTYAICFISIYGLSFSEAGQRVSELFKRRGVTTIANDTVVDVGLSAVVVVSSLCYLGAAYLVLVLTGDVLGMKGWPLSTSVIAFAFGYVFVAIIAGITTAVLRASYKAVFVCFVQDPEALAKSHGRQVYDDLSRAWREMELECPWMTSNASGGHHGIQDV
eukprot:g17984.t1